MNEKQELPPHDKRAEAGLLGSLLRHNGVIDEVTLILPDKQAFYLDAHQKIYQAILDLHDNGQPANFITLANALNDRNQIEDIGGYHYLPQLHDAEPTGANAVHYAKIVLDKKVKRDALLVSNEMTRDVRGGRPTQEMLRAAEQSIVQLAQQMSIGQVKPLSHGLREAGDEIDRWHTHSQDGITGLATGLVDLDELTCGLRKSELIILAARPGIGKTALALSIARHITVEQGLPVFFVSLEQSQRELALRLLSCQGKIDHQLIRKGGLKDEQLDKLVRTQESLDPVPLFIDDQPSQDMLRISANARLLAQKQKIVAVLLDYLQLIQPENRKVPRQEQVATTSRRLKILARELDLPVLALSQGNPMTGLRIGRSLPIYVSPERLNRTPIR